MEMHAVPAEIPSTKPDSIADSSSKPSFVGGMVVMQCNQNRDHSAALDSVLRMQHAFDNRHICVLSSQQDVVKQPHTPRTLQTMSNTRRANAWRALHHENMHTNQATAESAAACKI
jgi:hypothetical protein